MNQYDKAILDFNKVIELNPEDVDVFNNRGLTYGHMNQYDKAILDFNKVIELNPVFADAFYNRGMMFGKCNYLIRQSWISTTQQ